MSKSMCGRKAEKPASRAVVWLGRDEGFPLENGKTGMQGGRGVFCCLLCLPEPKNDAL